MIFVLNKLKPNKLSNLTYFTKNYRINKNILNLVALPLIKREYVLNRFLVKMQNNKSTINSSESALSKQKKLKEENQNQSNVFSNLSNEILKKTNSYSNKNKNSFSSNYKATKKTINNISLRNPLVTSPLIKHESELVVNHRKPIYSSYSKLSEVKLITIGIASPERIKQWAEKTLPSGKVVGKIMNANTLHHKTFKPVKGGLFCERIFGPLKDFQCACGKKPKKGELNQKILKNQSLSMPYANIDYLTKNKKEQTGANDPKMQNSNPFLTRSYCKECEVEYTWSVIRRYQLGYIELISPVTHVWYLKGNPSYLSILFDMKKRHVESIAYCSHTLTIENSFRNIYPSSLKKPSDIFASWQKTLKKIDSSSQNNEQTLTDKKNTKKNFKLQKRLKLNPLNLKLRANETLMFLKESYLNKENAELAGVKLEENSTNLDNSTITLKKTNTLMKNKIYNLKLWNFLLKFYKTNPDLLICFLNINKNEPNDYDQSQFKPISALNHHFSLKNVLKTCPIPFYIILKLNFLSETTTLKMLIKNIWKQIFRISYKKTLTLIKKFLFENNQCQTKTKFNELLNSKIEKFKILKKLTYFNLTNIKSITELSKSKAINLFFKNLKNNKNTKTLSNIMPLLKTLYKKQIIEEYEFGNLNYKLNIERFTYVKNSISTSNFYVSFENNKKLINKFKPIIKSLKYVLFNTIYKNFIFSFNNKNELINNKLTKKNFSYSYFFITNLINRIKTLYIKNKDLKFSSSKVNKVTRHFINKSSKQVDILIQFPFFQKPFINLKSESNYFVMQNMQTHIATTNIRNCDFFLAVQALPGLPLKKEVQELVQNIDVKLKNKDDLFQFLLSEKCNEFNKLTINLVEKPLIKSERALEPSLINNTINKQNQDSNIKMTSSKNKLYNNFYSLSHRERWDNEKDWACLCEFTGIKLEQKKEFFIPKYKNRLDLIFNLQMYGTTTNPTDREKKSNYKTIHMDKNNDMVHSSALFSGPGIISQLLKELDFYELKKMDKQNRILLYQLTKDIFKLKKRFFDRSAKKELKEAYKKRDILIRRTKLVRKLFRKESAPSAMILTLLPVLPPDLRPIVKIGGQIAASDLNRLYQRVIYRNDRLKKFLKDASTSSSYEMKYAQRLLQEAVDNLIQNGKSGVVSEKDNRGRALKSLSDLLKGKGGRFRQYLLGKRVDYSGRSVIVVGPKLKLHECGIPKEMALELYLPFLLKRILNTNLSKTVIGAKTLIKTNPSLTWELLREIMQTCPILLNRAPTLHRLGIQAFQPKLIDGRAILLHPLVCAAFNADFDGDQMAVHVPITTEARSEAWKLMLARNNILSPATGDPLAIPSQDMVLGCYYVTTNCNKKTIKYQRGSGFYFNSILEALKAYECSQIDLHANVWVKWNGLIENGSDQEEPVEIQLNKHGYWKEIYASKQKTYDYNNLSINQYICTTPGKILFNLTIQKILK
uniref:RNA polymerase beta' subunit n=1 Tax=Chlamydomonas chlamydogama TaxID=225041 RepID=UPI00226CBBC6|nr:RNA polymerase beta' subunit [Chlamydomonas chlamydogama]UZA61915.1 RNA polymerase beta' subunit [Chlamydomonas chlamydogama]